jgi:DNA polymerase
MVASLLGDREHLIWQQTQRLNTDGIGLDGALIRQMKAIVTARLAAVNDELCQVTAGAVETVHQVARLSEWARRLPHGDVPNLQAETLEAVLLRDDLAPELRQAFELRLEAAHGSKVESLQDCRGLDGRARDFMTYCGAGTGRFSSYNPQFHNLQREDGDTAVKVAAIMTGDLAAVAELGPVMKVIGTSERAVICAPPPGRLGKGDLASIESRVLAHLAGEQWKVDGWAKSDRTGLLEDDLYYQMGQRCGLPEAVARERGKVIDLAFGFQGGVNAYKRKQAVDDPATDLDVERFKQTWRAMHPQTVRFWDLVNYYTLEAVKRPRTVLTYKQLAFFCDGTFLMIQLPSGRTISYPFPRIGVGRYNSPVVIFKDVIKHKFIDCGSRDYPGFYGGAFVENIVQGFARDILCDAILRLEEHGYRVVLHIHDEIICEMPEGGSLEEFKELIEQAPVWAPGLPIRVKARLGPRLADIDTPVDWEPGSLDTVPLYSMHKEKTIKRRSEAPATPLPLIPDMVAQSIAYIIERHTMQTKKESGLPPPYSDDPLLAVGHFCHIHHEDDQGSRWKIANIIAPNRDDPDLVVKVALACFINEPAALAEIDWQKPVDLGYYRTVLEARQVRGETVFRTKAYKPPMPPEGMGTLRYLFEAVLPQIMATLTDLRPRDGDTLQAFVDRWCQIKSVGTFLSAQIAAFMKRIAPLCDAADHQTFAAPGPGSMRGLNWICGRDVKASWREPVWRATLLNWLAEIAPQLEAAGVPGISAQDGQHNLCELDKLMRARAGGKLRKYAALVEAPAKVKQTKPAAENSEELNPEPSDSSAIPDYILNDIRSQAKTPEPEPEPEPSEDIETPELEPEPEATETADGYPRNERKTGKRDAFYIYRDARERYYLGVERWSHGADKWFPQKHWTGKQWAKGAPKGPKIPYRLPELLDASHDTWIVIAAGEKDAETAVKLGFVATTNPGGEIPGAWAPELGRWFSGYARVAIMEDHDDTGKAHAIEVATALAGIVPDIRIVTFHELPAHGDLTDWVKTGHDHAALLKKIEATPRADTDLGEWDAGELLRGPLPAPRQWLVGGIFCRTFLSGLVAPGDVGKTTLRLTQAIELATGRELLGLRVYHRCKVLVISFEDDRTELHRRLLAICQHHGIDPAELKGWLFCRDLNGGAKLAELDAKGRRRQIGRLDGMLRRAIKRTQCDLVVLDPFVKLHALNESDNPDMDFVCSALIRIAQDCGIAVDSPAHTHKGAIQAGDADARRGASAQRDAGRLDYTLTVMSGPEAEQFGINLDERKRYMRLDKAKANIVRAVKARWFKLVSVRLNNADSVYVEGDEVQAIERWETPETWEGAEPETLNAILDALASGLPDGRRYSDHSRAQGREAWQVVQKHCPGKAEAQCREMIRQWIKAGALFEKDYDDPVARKERKGLFLDPGKRPHY